MQQTASLADSRTGFCRSMMGTYFFLDKEVFISFLLRCSIFLKKRIFPIEFSHVFLLFLAVAGDGDGIVSASDMEALAQALPRSTSATVANAGHVPMLEARGGNGLDSSHR